MSEIVNDFIQILIDADENKYKTTLKEMQQYITENNFDDEIYLGDMMDLYDKIKEILLKDEYLPESKIYAIIFLKDII